MLQSLKYCLCFVVLLVVLLPSSGFAQYNEADLAKQANSLFASGDYGEALPLFSQLLSLHPASVEYNFRYGACALYGDAQKKEEAVKYLRFASSQAGTAPEVWFYLGRAYHLNYRFAEALQAFKKFQELADKKTLEKYQLQRHIDACQNGLNLLSDIKEVVVLDKTNAARRDFFRLYDLRDIGGRIVVTPEELLSNEDKKRGHRSLIHFPGNRTTIYFSSYGKDGSSGLDIYSAEILPGGKYSTPKKVEGLVNGPYDEDYPFLHPDSKTLYFSSTGHNSMGGYDVFKSVVDPASGTFGPSENLDFAVNTPDDDLFYIADSLNHLANFSSTRASKQGRLDVYKVEVSSRPLDITMVKGTFVNEVDPTRPAARILVVDANTNEVVDSVFTDPLSGDYVLSFPQGGKYKLEITAADNKTTSTTMVDIPYAQGVKAYLQETTLGLSGGVEKISVSNHFDRYYEGDVTLLASQILKNRANLDVTPQKATQPVAEAGNSKDLVNQAYLQAGFSAGMSNEKILADAKQRTQTLAKRREELATVAAKSFAMAQSLWEKSDSTAKQINELKSQVESQPPGDERNKTLLRIGILQYQSSIALRKAKNAMALAGFINDLSQQQDSLYTISSESTAALEQALTEDNSEVIVSALRQEKMIRETAAFSARPDPVQKLRLAAGNQQEKSDNFLNRAQALRRQQTNLEQKFATNQKQIVTAGNKEAALLERENQTLQEDISAARRKAEKAFEQAKEMQDQAFALQEQYEFLSAVNNDAATGMENYASIPTLSPSLFQSLLNQLVQTSEVVDAVEVDPVLLNTLAEKYSDQLSVLSPEDQESFTKHYRSAAAGQEVLLAETTDSEDDPSGEATGAGAEPEAETAEAIPAGLEENDLAAAQSINAANVEEPAAGVVQQEQDADAPLEKILAEATAEEISATENSGSIPNLENPSADSTSQVISTEVAVVAESSADETTSARPSETANLPEQEPANQEITAQKSQVRPDNSQTALSADGELANPNELEANPNQNETDSTPNSEGENEFNSVVADISISTADTLFDVNAVADPQIRIEQESEKIAAAEDWLEIIDESIATLKNNPLNEGHNQQLAQYEKLKATKLAEIEIATSRIAKLQGVISEREKAENDLAAVTTENEIPANIPTPENEAERDSSITLAESILPAELIEAVSPGYSEQLESLTDSEMPDSVRLQKKINLKRSLLQKLENSSPDLANAAQITELQQQISKEIQQDEEELNLVEPLAQNTKTAAGSSVEKSSSKPIEPKDTTPDEIAAAAGALETKEVATAADSADTSNIQSAPAEEAATEEMAENIPEVNSSGSTSQPPGNFEAKKSAGQGEAVGLNNSDEGATATNFISEENEAGKNLESTVVENSGDEQTSVSEIQPDSLADVALKNWQLSLKNIEADLAAGFATAEQTKLAPASVLEQKALLNQRAARAIQQEIGKLTAVLDRTTISAEKQDEVQVEIQKMQSLRADKLQEYDRLSAEAEQQKLVADAKPDSVESLPGVASDTLLSSENVALLLDSVVLEKETAEVAAMKDIASRQPDSYKFLSANVRIEKMRQPMQQYSQLQAEMEAGLKTISQLPSGTEKLEAAKKYRQMEARAANLELEMVELAASANATEIALYQEAIAALNQEVQSQSSETFAAANEGNDTIEAQIAESLAAAQVMRERSAFAESAEEKIARQREALKLEKQAIDLFEVEYDRLNELLQKNAVAENAQNPNEPLKERAGASGEQNALETTPSVAEKSQPDSETATTSETTSASETGSNTKTATIATKAAKAQNKTISGVEIQLLDSIYAPSAKEREVLAKTPALAEYLLVYDAKINLQRKLNKGIETSSMLELSAAEQHIEAERLKKQLETSPGKDREFLEKKIERLEAQAAAGRQQALVANQLVQELSEKVDKKSVTLDQLRPKLSVAQQQTAQNLIARSKEVSLPENAGEVLATAKNKEPRAEQTTGTGEEPLPTSREQTSILAVAPGVAAISEKALVEKIREGRFDQTINFQESVFFTTPEPLYSAATPIPVNAGMPDGLVFQVQVGAFRNPIPQDLFAGLAPVMGEKLQNGITRYRVGLFREFEKAATARSLVREMGYSDAFVVVYFNGKRLSAADARKLIQQAEQDLLAAAKTSAKPEAKSEIAPGTASSQPQLSDSETTGNVANARDTGTAKAPEKANAAMPLETAEAAAAMMAQYAERTTYYRDSTAAGAAQVEVTPGLFYTVQVGVYSKPVSLQKLFGLTDLNTELTATGNIRYTTGRFGSVDEAQDQKMAAIAAGVEDAFITAYYNGKRIGLAQAAELLQQHGQNVLWRYVGLSAPEKYYVYIGPFVNDVPQDIANTILALSRFGFQKIVDSGDEHTYYMSKPFEKEKEAQNLLEKLQKNGVELVSVKSE